MLGRSGGAPPLVKLGIRQFGQLWWPIEVSLELGLQIDVWTVFGQAVYLKNRFQHSLLGSQFGLEEDDLPGHLVLVEAHEHVKDFHRADYSSSEESLGCATLLGQFNLQAGLGFGDVLGKVHLEAVLGHNLYVVGGTPENGNLRIVRDNVLVLVVATHVQVSHAFVVEARRLVWNLKGEAVLALGKHFAMAPLETSGGVTGFVLQHAVDELAQVGGPDVVDVGSSGHFCHNRMLGCSTWLHPQQHVPVNCTSTLVLFLNYGLGDNTKRTSLVIPQNGHEPVVSLLGGQYGHLRFETDRLSVAEVSGEVLNLDFIGTCSPPVPQSGLHLGPAVVGSECEKEIGQAPLLYKGH